MGVTTGKNLSFRGLMPPDSEAMQGESSGSRIPIGFQKLQEDGVRYRGSRGRVKPYGRLWPNGEFSVSWPRRESVADVPSAGGEYKKSVSREWVAAGVAVISDMERRQANREARVRLACLWSEIITSVKIPRKNGMTGITSYGKKMVRSAATILQRRYGKHRLTFLTLTVPELPSDSLVKVASRWGDLVRQLIQWIGRRLEARSLPKQVVSVTECQPKRLRDGNPGCLHVHAAFSGYDRVRKTWAIHYKEVRQWWNAAISRVVGFEVRSNSVENMKKVKTSVSGYLGKYMSKGSAGLDVLVQEHGPEVIPGQWWNMTADMRRAVKAESMSGEDVGVILELIVDAYFCGNEGFPGFLQAHHIDLDGFQFLVAYGGRLDRATEIEVREWAQCQRVMIGA